MTLISRHRGVLCGDKCEIHAWDYMADIKSLINSKSRRDEEWRNSKSVEHNLPLIDFQECIFWFTVGSDENDSSIVKKSYFDRFRIHYREKEKWCCICGRGKDLFLRLKVSQWNRRTWGGATTKCGADNKRKPAVMSRTVNAEFQRE